MASCAAKTPPCEPASASSRESMRAASVAHGARSASRRHLWTERPPAHRLWTGATHPAGHNPPASDRGELSSTRCVARGCWSGLSLRLGRRRIRRARPVAVGYRLGAAGLPAPTSLEVALLRHHDLAAEGAHDRAVLVVADRL